MCFAATRLFHGDPGQTRGVTVGSKVKKVNGEPVTSLTYQETLERIKVSQGGNGARGGRELVESSAEIASFARTYSICQRSKTPRPHHELAGEYPASACSEGSMVSPCNWSPGGKRFGS